MDITEVTQGWKKEHFIAYIFLCIAAADYDVAEEEVEVLKTRINEVVGDEADANQAIEQVRDLVDYHDDDEKTDIIAYYSNLFEPTLEEKFLICNILEEIIKADGIVEGIEMVIFRFIKKALG
ncbi:MAG: TerB family tellurite resistance protein [Cyclobacteriaceae bacterium]